MTKWRIAMALVPFLFSDACASGPSQRREETRLVEDQADLAGTYSGSYTLPNSDPIELRIEIDRDARVRALVGRSRNRAAGQVTLRASSSRIWFATPDSTLRFRGELTDSGSSASGSVAACPPCTFGSPPCLAPCHSGTWTVRKQ
jgi:hypothetical protein